MLQSKEILADTKEGTTRTRNTLTTGWNLLIDDLIWTLNDRGIWSQGFTEDLVIVTIGTFPL